jgi:hypothetical protein
VHGEPVGPGGELLRAPKAGEVPPEIDECLLEGVLRPVVVTEDPERDPSQPHRALGRERVERVCVSTTGLLDEGAAHRSCSGRTPAVRSPE